jgi:hypothetical protein
MVTAAWLIVAAPATAGTLTVDYAKASISYKAGAGEDNKVSISRIGGGMTVIQDHGVAQVPLGELGGSLCMLMEDWKYKCPIAGLATASVDLGDGTDTFDAASSSLAVSVDAGAGSKTISTGSGNDQIFARNGVADQISCGAGDDTVVADSQDAVASDCEHVDLGDGIASSAPGSSATATVDSTARPGATSPGTRLTQGNASALQTPLGLTLPVRTLAMPRPNTALVPLACAATAVGGCRGDIVLESRVGSGKAASHGKLIAARGHFVAQQRARRPGARRIGSRQFRLAAGQKTALPVRIRFRGHFTAVERRRRKRAILKVVERDAAGKVVDVQTRVVTLKLSNKQSRARRSK